MKELDASSVESSEMVEQTFDFWFKDSGHIRSPFPAYIHTELKEKSIQRFFEWTSKLEDKASKEINDTIIAEKFEEIIFEIALELVLTEDEKLTINYPFMPRVGDEISSEKEEDKEPSLIINRSIDKNADHLFMKVQMEKKNSKVRWETKFELPA